MHPKESRIFPDVQTLPSVSVHESIVDRTHHDVQKFLLVGASATRPLCDSGARDVEPSLMLSDPTCPFHGRSARETEVPVVLWPLSRLV